MLVKVNVDLSKIIIALLYNETDKIYISKIKHNKQTSNTPELIRGKIKKKLRESPGEFTVSKLLAKYFVAKPTKRKIPNKYYKRD